MSAFDLPNTTPLVSVKLSADLAKDELLSFPAFKTWLSTLQKSLKLQQDPSHPFHETPYMLHSIQIQSHDRFGGGRLGFLKLKAEITNEKGERLPGSVFLRGGSVAMLLILSPQDATETDSDHVILTVQPRIAAGSLGFVELPAGMLDDSGTFSGAAAKEIREETGLEIAESELINMSQLTYEASLPVQRSKEDYLQQAIYPSPGGSDEFIPLFLAQKKMKKDEIDGLKGKLTGLRGSGEKITLQICRLDELWKVAARDGKTLAALALYEGLKRENKL